MLKNFPIELFVLLLCSCLCTLVQPSLNNRSHFLTFPLFIAPSPYTSSIWLWISAKWTFLAFKSHITNCTSQVVGFQFSCSSLTLQRGVMSTARHAALSHSFDYISTTKGNNVIGMWSCPMYWRMFQGIPHQVKFLSKILLLIWKA